MLKRRTLLLLAVFLLAISNSCYSSLLENKVTIDIQSSFEFFGISVNQSKTLDVLVGEGVEAAVTITSASINLGIIGEVHIPDRTFEIDLSNSSILIKAHEPSAFLGNLIFIFSGFEPPAGAVTKISNASIRQPNPAPSNDLDLTFDTNSIAIEYFYDILAPTTYSEIEIGVALVPINLNGAMLIICPFILLTLVRSDAKSMSPAMNTPNQRMMSLAFSQLGRLTARFFNVLTSLHFQSALQSAPYSKR